MRSNHLFALGALSLVVAVAGVTACGSSSGTGAGGSTTTGTGGGATGSGGSTTVPTTGGGGNTAEGNHSFETASDLTVDGTANPGALVDPSTPDFYKFTLDKTYPFYASASAQRLAAGGDATANLNDPTIADTVISIYDSTKKLIASDDDEWPRSSTDSQLFAELPAGDYFLKIEDCNSFADANPSSGIHCADATAITTLDYELTAFPMDRTKFPQGSTAGSTITYSVPQGGTAGQYGIQDITGDFAASGEIHKFTVTVPPDVALDAAARGRLYFWVQPVGAVNGDGSASNIKIRATSDAAGTTLLGSADQNNYKDGDDPTNGPLLFSIPLKLTSAGALDTTGTYYLWVENTGGNSYYFINSYVGSFYYGEAEAAAAHTDKATAQVLTVPGTTNEGTYFIDGTLSTPTEVDWFRVDVPATVTDNTGAKVAPKATWLACESGREGSGLKGFTATLVDTNGADTSVKLTESNPAKIDLTVGADGKTMLPTGVTPGQPAYLKISATGQDAANPATYYRCSVYFF